MVTLCKLFLMLKHVANKGAKLDQKDKYGMESINISEIDETDHCLEAKIMTAKDRVERVEWEIARTAGL